MLKPIPTVFGQNEFSIFYVNSTPGLLLLRPGCQIFRVPRKIWTPKPEKYTKSAQNVPNGHKIYQMSIHKYSQWL
jgi:hypothetical protein